MSTKTKLLITAVIALGVLTLGAASLALNQANLDVSQQRLAQEADMALALTLPPLEALTFTDVSPTNIVAPDARRFAVFSPALAQTAHAASTNFIDESPGTPAPVPPGQTNDGGEGPLTFYISTTLRYRLPQGEVVVVTCKPSVDALELRHYLGDPEVTLGNGTPAWVVAFDKPTPFPNRVLFIQNEQLVTVASTLPLAEVQQLATEVVMK